MGAHLEARVYEKKGNVNKHWHKFICKRKAKCCTPWDGCAYPFFVVVRITNPCSLFPWGGGWFFAHFFKLSHTTRARVPGPCGRMGALAKAKLSYMMYGTRPWVRGCFTMWSVYHPSASRGPRRQVCGEPEMFNPKARVHPLLGRVRSCFWAVCVWGESKGKAQTKKKRKTRW